MGASTTHLRSVRVAEQAVGTVAHPRPLCGVPHARGPQAAIQQNQYDLLLTTLRHLHNSSHEM